MALLSRWTRRKRRPGPVAFVLSGGGNLGALQIGMLRALAERDLRPEMILGCSVGAINGARLAGDPTLAGGAPRAGGRVRVGAPVARDGHRRADAGRPAAPGGGAGPQGRGDPRQRGP